MNNNTDKILKTLNFIKYMLRIGIACTFIGHGMNAIDIKQNWIPLLTVYGFSVEHAKILMPWIGALDILVALLVLIHPYRAVVIWAIFWTLATALTRVIAGEGVWEFIERAANWSAPLALLLLTNLETADQKTKWIAVSGKAEENPRLALLMKKFPFFFILLIYTRTGTAQTVNDTTGIHHLKAVEIEALHDPGIQHMENIKGTYLFSGKKTEVLNLSKTTLSLSEKHGRQIFSKIPGAFIYDMDGTGNQLNISMRGLDAHRSWEFNLRKDGIITNSDMYGYPASHYNLPMEAVDRIEIVRGTGALQYGAQFGGLINYVSKQPDSTKRIAFESINTIGSYGLFSTYSAISGKSGKFRYSAWMNKKGSDGYRENSNSGYNAEAISLFYDISKKMALKVEWTHSNYLIRLAGPLTDAQFKENPQAATRSRNYYNPNIHIPSITYTWKFRTATTLQLTSSAVIGARNSVLFDKPATVRDSISPVTMQYNSRQVDIDNFNSYTTELRILHSYSLFKQLSTFTTGVQYMNNDLHRRQLGKGTTGSDYDLELATPGWGRDLHYRTFNMAFFIENHWALSSRFSVNTGVRLENGETHMLGSTTYYSDAQLPTRIQHQFPLLGISAQYKIGSATEAYGGYSNAYRPVIFKDIIPTSVYEVTDKNLKDAFGHNLEVGVRGHHKGFSWDATAFHIQYHNRLGTLAQQDDKNNLIIFRTNIGNSKTYGIELAMQQQVKLASKTFLSLFTATSYMDARYTNAIIRSGNANMDVSGNKVESTPEWISRNGITFRYAAWSISGLYSYTSGSFADALNSVDASSTGATGYVPAYQLIDCHLAVRLTEQIRLQFNINNLLDEHYFTKRPQFYPGPGIWPSDGRTFSATANIKI